jgi:two-component system chemotaxis sensor kinase CheA
MDQLLKDFLAETAEQIESVGTQLVLLEREPSDAAMIASIFRLVHTIKGTCGFLGLNRLGQLAHAAETLIGRIRDPFRSDRRRLTAWSICAGASLPRYR